MHAKLYIGKDKDQIERTIVDIEKTSINNMLVFELQKIDHVRDLSKTLKLSSKQKRRYLFRDFDKATTEAMNAFLKMLEEPGEGVSYILTASTTANILPTILSRVEIIRTKSKIKIDHALASDFLDKTITERLKKIDSIKKRDEALEFISDLNSSFHKLMLNTDEAIRKSEILKAGQEAASAIEKNGNINLHLSKFVLIIDK